MLTITLSQLSPSIYELQSVPTMTVFDGMTYLIELEKAFQMENLSGTVTLSITDSVTKAEKYVDFFPLGKGLASELLTYIEKKLAQTYPDRLEERERLMDELSDALMESMTSLPSVPTLVRIGTTSYGVATKESTISHIHQSRPSKRKQMRWLFLVVPLVCLLLAGAGVSGWYVINQVQSDKGRVATNDSSATEADYFERAKKDSSEANLKEIEEELVANKAFDVLKKFNHAYPTPEGMFDLAFHEKEWQVVLDTPLSFFSKDRQRMMAYAHIQLGELSETLKQTDVGSSNSHLKEATVLNDTIKDDQLTTAIEATYFYNGLYLLEKGDIKSAESLEKTITHADYPELLATAKILVERIESLKKDKKMEESKNWVTVLSTIGKEYRQDNDTK